LREQVETLFVTRDWFEAFVAQNLVADSYVYPLFFSHFEAQFTRVYGASLSILTDYLLEWQKEVARWVDAVIKTAAKEGAENQQLLETWVSRWRAAFEEAVSPLAVELLGGDEAEVVLDEINADINKRIAKLGVA
jgi:phenol hydroxylase P1 protein